MVRFIMCVSTKKPESSDKFTFQYGQIYYAGIRDDEFLNANIYIPIWLDLLLILTKPTEQETYNLHSNMVRFII